MSLLHRPRASHPAVGQYLRRLMSTATAQPLHETVGRKTGQYGLLGMISQALIVLNPAVPPRANKVVLRLSGGVG